MVKKNSTYYQGNKNPLGNDGKVLKCFNCQSEYPFAQKCDEKKKDQEENKEDEAMLTVVIENMLKQ